MNGAQSDVTSSDVVIIGAGLVGLVNAIQYAKRGLSVTLVDPFDEKEQERYKVGESLLVYSNAFLRAIGGIDAELRASRPKGGFWMAHGMEGRKAFDETVNEWGFQSRLPDHWQDRIPDKKFERVMFGDVQICRPDIESALRANLSDHPEIELRQGRVTGVDLGRDSHHVAWSEGRHEGALTCRWVIDCSGRSRVLPRQLGTDTRPPRATRTSSAWAHFAHCTDDLFDDRWTYEFPDGERIDRDDDTVHLWGDGYWIWVIKLADERVSIGVSWDRDVIWPDGNARDVFWEAISRFPVLSWVETENLLAFSAYKNVQQYTDTFVSQRRFAVTGDASTMVDAYYSQGISLSLQQSWHVANLVEDDVRDGYLDREYIDRINSAATADWRLVASMVKGKYGPAMADSRFFTLDHFLDYMIMGAALLGRYQISRWLAETDGITAQETDIHSGLRQQLRSRLFLSQSSPWHAVDPTLVAALVERWRDVLEANALWRLEHGIRLEPTKTGLRSHAGLPAIWRLPRAQREMTSLTLPAIPEPEFMGVTGTEQSPLMLLGTGPMLLTLNLGALAFDVADTWRRRAARRVRRAIWGTKPTLQGVAA